MSIGPGRAVGSAGALTCLAVASLAALPGARAGTVNADGGDTDAPLYVKAYAWTSNVQDKQPTEPLHELPYGGPLFLWTLLVGKQAALDEIRARGQLAIRHEWYLECDDQTKQPAGVASLVLDAGDSLPALEYEVKKRDWFDWRTWSGKRIRTSCTYIVRIVDEHDQPLYCAELGGACEVALHPASD